MVPIIYSNIDLNSLAAVIQPIQNTHANTGCQQIQLPNGGLYEGEVQKGMPHGKGILHYKQSTEFFFERYEGDFVNGVPHGLGKIVWTDGSIYEGAFENDNMQGHGTKIWSIGKQDKKYVGEWKKGQMDGQGTMISINKDTRWKMIFEGEWKNDKMEGQGTITTKHPETSEIFPRATRSSDRKDIGNLEVEDNKQTGVFKDGKLWEGELKAGKFTSYYMNGEKQPKELATAPNAQHIQLPNGGLYQEEMQKDVPDGKETLHSKQLTEKDDGKKPKRNSCIIF